MVRQTTALPTDAAGGAASEHARMAPDRSGDAVAELDHRTCGSIDVSLFWNRVTNTLFVQVIDWSTDDDFSIEVSAATASQVFRHPFAYVDGPE
jgi:hypothetical protein